MLAVALDIARPIAVAAEDGAAARQAVRTIVDRAIAILERPDTADRDDAFLRLFRHEFATAAIARFVLGAYRSNATPAQFERYLSIFETMVAKMTAARLADYAGETVEIEGARADGKRWVVSSRVRPKQGEPVRLDWVLAPSGGAFKVVDLRVENLSLALTQRDEFASVLQRNNGDIDGLIAFMRDKIKKLDAGGVG